MSARLRMKLSAAVIAVAGASTATTVSAQPPAPAIAAAPVIQRDVAAGQTFVATVRPTRSVVIGSATSGRVAECRFEEGDRVEAMDEMVHLLTETIEAEIASAEAELRLREQELQELQNGTRPEELEQARARMLAAESRERYTDMTRKRIEQLFQQGSASVNERDEAVTLHTQAVNEYLDAKKAFELAEVGPRPERIAQAEARKEMQQAVVKKLRDQQRKHTMFARFGGYVTRKLTEVGAWVNAGDDAYEVVALDQVDVEAFVAEQQVSGIKLDSDVRVEVPALDDRVFVGRVYRVIPQAELKTRTFPVRIRVTNEFDSQVPLLKAGMLARVHLPIGARRPANLVDKDALVFTGPQTSVFVIDPDESDPSQGTVRSVPVRLGVAQDGWIQVLGEIETGQRVVVEGNERLRPGQSVIVAEVREPPPEPAEEAENQVPAEDAVAAEN